MPIVHSLRWCALALVCAFSLPGQEAPPTAPADTIDKRIFGVLPNYRTADGTQPFTPLTWKRKMYIAFKDSTDWPVFPVAAFFAATYQWQDQNPSFGQGMKGYGKRFVTSYADQSIGNFMTEGIMPGVFHEDPRYFRKGSGSVGARLGYALTRILVCKTDAGRSSFNFAEIVGNGTTAAIGNAYYPDSRSASDTMQRWAIALATDAISQVGKEFWPDVKRKLFTHPHQAAEPRP